MFARVQNLESMFVLNAETSLTGSSGAQTGLTNRLIGLIDPIIPDSFDLVPRVENSASDNLKHDKADVVDWRKSIIEYLQDPSQKVDTKVQRLAFRFTLVDGDLYHRTTDDLLLKCSDSE
jgi:hypothetical protein